MAQGATYSDLTGQSTPGEQDWFTQNAPPRNPFGAVPGSEATPDSPAMRSSVEAAAVKNSAARGGVTGYSGAKDPNAIIAYWKQSHPASAPDLPGLIALLNQQGFQTSQATHAGGALSDDKIIVNGKMLDLGSSFGGAGATWFDSPLEVGGGSGDASYGSLLEPFGGQMPDYNAYPAFQLPTGEEALKQDPGYGFRLGQGQQALLQKRAAGQVLNSPATYKALIDYNQNAASQEYGLAANRALQTYQTNYGTQIGGNYQNLYQRYLDQAQQFRNRQSDTFNYLSTPQAAPVTG